MKHLRRLVFSVIVAASSGGARAESQFIAGGGFHSLDLVNSLTETTYTTPGKISSFSGEITRSIRKGRVSIGVRAFYLTASILAGDVELKYIQAPVFGTLGYVLGSSLLRLKIVAGAGYPFLNRMTFTGSGTATDGVYDGKALMLLSSTQLQVFFGRKARLGFYAEGGYVYSFSKILFHTPFTSEDLDGDASGYFAHGGLIYRF